MSDILKYYSVFKERYRNSNNKSVLQNFVALFILQISNYLLPLIILPYLTQMLGPANYGKISWAQYAIQYFVIFTDYGFNFSATRLISIHRENKNYLNSIFTAVLLIKVCLMIFGFLVLQLWINFGEFSNQDVFLLNVSYLIVAGSVLTPIWLFQGIEKMRWVTIANVFIKFLLVVIVFILVRKSSDVELTATLMSFTQLLIGVVSVLMAVIVIDIRIVAPDKKFILHQFKEGWVVFISTLFTAVYVTSNGFLLGEWVSDDSVGYYSPAEKIVRAVTSFFNPVLLALYPFISRKFSENSAEAIQLFFKILKWVSLFTFMASIILLVLAPFADDFFGHEYEKSIDIIRWLSVIPFFGVAGAMLSYHLFLNTSLSKYLPLLLFILMVIDLVLCYLLIPLYKETGAAMALAITEVVAPLLYLIVYFSKKKMIV